MTSCQEHHWSSESCEAHRWPRRRLGGVAARSGPKAAFVQCSSIHDAAIEEWHQVLEQPMTPSLSCVESDKDRQD